MNVVAAVVAGVGRPTGHTVVFPGASALVAIGNPARVTLLHDELKASVVGRELSVEIANRVPKMLRYRLLATDSF